MKKIVALLLLITLITSCSSSAEVVEQTNEAAEINVVDYIVGGKASNYFNVYGNILNNNLNTLTSNIAGEVSALSCEAGARVTPNTIVARISPDSDSLSYKNNLVQLNSLKSQLSNLEEIKQTTITSFETQFRQLELQEQELANQRENVDQTIGDEDEGLRNQLKIVEESIVLLEENKASAVKTIDDSILNANKTSYNSTVAWVKRLDEVFGITDKNEHLNDDYEDYLGKKDTGLKNSVKNDVKSLIEEMEDTQEYFVNYTNQELSVKLEEYSVVFSDAADVVDNSIASLGRLTETEIDTIYAEFNGYSDALVAYKTALDGYINSRNTTILTYDVEAKELESAKSEIITNENSLNRNKDTIANNEETIKEQYASLESSKEATLKEIENNIISLEQAIDQLNISFREDVIYAGTSGTVKTKNVSIHNNVGIGTPICTIVPDNNSLKLEIYSPNTLEIGMEFEYYKDEKLLGIGTIISESPVRNSTTQNYTYEGEINFLDFKEGDYIDIKVITEVSEDEIWIPLQYVAPKLDGYYVDVKNENGELESRKVEVGKMNGGEIKVESGLELGDILQ